MRWISFVFVGLLGGCFLFSRPAESANTSAARADEQTQPIEPIEPIERGELIRAGVFALGDYLFEVPSATGGIERRVARLERFGPGELEISRDGERHTLTHERGWPMLCLKAPIRYRDGDLRIELRAGAPVYVIASSRDQARIGPVPRVGHGRVVERAQLSLEGCVDSASSTPSSVAHVASTEPLDTACLFADSGPVDEADGFPIPSHAALDELERDEDWVKVRLEAAFGRIEGWMPATLIASGATPESPDWIAAALQTRRCMYPERPATEPARAWVERSADELPAPAIAPFEAILSESEPRVRACYDALPIEERPTQVAYVEIRLDVDGDGQVASAAVLRREHAPLSLARCMMERARRIRFPAPRTGIVLRRTYAFDPPPRPMEAESDGSEAEEP